MIHHALPIKCLEATVLAMYLTLPYRDVVRFTVIFHSTIRSASARTGSVDEERLYKHIVLGGYILGK